MNQTALGVVILLLVLVIANKLLALPQIRKLNQQLLDIKKTGPVSSVGMARHWYGNRAYVLVTDKQGNIMSAHQTNSNFVFAGFQEDTAIAEKNYNEILEKLSAQKKLTRLEEAKLMAAKYLENGLNAEDA